MYIWINYFFTVWFLPICFACLRFWVFNKNISTYDFYSFVECESGRAFSSFSQSKYYLSPRLAWRLITLGWRCLYCFCTVHSPRHFHLNGRRPSSLKSPHFTSGRHDASTRLLLTVAQLSLSNYKAGIITFCKETLSRL